jgi:hypothetical protein
MIMKTEQDAIERVRAHSDDDDLLFTNEEHWHMCNCGAYWYGPYERGEELCRECRNEQSYMSPLEYLLYFVCGILGVGAFVFLVLMTI